MDERAVRPAETPSGRSPAPDAAPRGPALGSVRPLREPPPPDVQALPQPARDSPDPVSPAVVALLNSADTQERSGAHEQAADSLERALQIEPGYAWAWHRLARVRYEQGQYGEAASLAAKSIAMGPGNRPLLADNWALIAKVRRRQGNLDGARAAQRIADQYSDGRR